MKDIRPVGSYIEIVDARSPENPNSIFQVGLRQSTFSQLAKTGQATKCAQLYGLIQPGLMNAVHAFLGLKRPLMRADDMQGDANVVAYSWRPEFDYVWSGSRSDGHPTEKTPPDDVVFVVLVQVFKTPEVYPDFGQVWGSIEHWSWIVEDFDLPLAPIKWNERYEQHLWSRKP